jgi:hypothetical protein
MGDGSTTCFNPNKMTGGMDSKGSKMRDPYIALAHELGHAEAIDKGTQSHDEGNKEPGTTPPSEKNSMERENEVRKENDKPDRPSYYEKKEEVKKQNDNPEIPCNN